MLLPLYFVTYLLSLSFYLLCQAPNNRQLHCFAVVHCPGPVTPCRLYHYWSHLTPWGLFLGVACLPVRHSQAYVASSSSAWSCLSLVDDLLTIRTCQLSFVFFCCIFHIRMLLNVNAYAFVNVEQN